MRTSNINSTQNCTTVFDSIQVVGDSYLGQPNDATNQLWSKDYRGYIISCGDGGSAGVQSTITFLNNDNTTATIKIPESSLFNLVLPLHAKITNINVISNALLIVGIS